MQIHIDKGEILCKYDFMESAEYILTKGKYDFMESAEYYKKLGNLMSSIRKIKNISRVKAAEYLGIPSTNLRAYEIGKARFPIDAFSKLTKLFNVDDEYIIFLLKMGI